MKITMDEILFMSALEKVTGVSAKDCLIDGQLITFLVPEKMVGKAIGKQAVNVKTLEQKLNKRVEIVAYSEKPEEIFSRALEVNFSNAKKSGNRLIVMLDATGKAKAFKNNARIKRVKELIHRSFGLELVIN